MPIQFVEQLHAIFSPSGWSVRPKVEDRHSSSETASLIDRRHPTARPVANAIDGQAARIGQHDVRRQVLILAAERIRRPCADRRPAGDDHAGVHHPQRLLVIAMFREHRSHDGDLVGVARNVLKRVGEVEPRLAMLAKAKRGLEEIAGEPFIVGSFDGRRWPS